MIYRIFLHRSVQSKRNSHWSGSLENSIEVLQKNKLCSILIQFSPHQNKERVEKSQGMTPQLDLSSHSQDRLDQFSYVTRLLDWIEYERD